MSRALACKCADVEEGDVYRVQIAGRAPIAIYRIDGALYATDETCTHGEGPLSEGIVEDGAIVCPFHLGSFDIRTGEPLAPPCTVALRTYPVLVEGDTVFVEL